MSRSESFKLRFPSTDLAQVRSSAEAAGISIAEVVRRGAMKEAERILSRSRSPSYLQNSDRDVNGGNS